MVKVYSKIWTGITVGIVALGGVFSAHASFWETVNSESSWEEIFNSNTYVAVPPWTQMGAGGVFDTCWGGDFIRTIDPVKTCVETKNIARSAEAGPEYACTRTVEEYKYLPTTIDIKTCKTWVETSPEVGDITCTDWGYRTIEINRTNQVPVHRRANSQEDNLPGRYSFSKEYKMPACY